MGERSELIKDSLFVVKNSKWGNGENGEKKWLIRQKELMNSCIIFRRT